jgi:hypothetical protein
MEKRTAEPLLSDASSFAVEILNTKLEKYKSPGYNQTMAELIHRKENEYGLKSISSIILFGIKKICLIKGRSLLL